MKWRYTTKHVVAPNSVFESMLNGVLKDIDPAMLKDIKYQRDDIVCSALIIYKEEVDDNE